jgi:hydroxyethylthiazole kinase
MAASVIAAFAAVEKDLAAAAAAGLVCFEVAAENAAKSAKGPASFKERLFDELYLLTPIEAGKKQKVICA